MPIVREFEEAETEVDGAKGVLLDTLAQGKPYVFITVTNVNLKEGSLQVHLDHNAPEGEYGAMRMVLEQVLATLPNDDLADD